MVVDAVEGEVFCSDQFLTSSSCVTRLFWKATHFIQEIIDLVDTSLESGSSLSNDPRVSISLGLFVECARDLVECSLPVSA